MRRKLKFQTKIVIAAIMITFIPLLFSYGIFIEDQLSTIDTSIRERLREAALTIKDMPIVQEKLASRENDMSLQYYTQGLIQNLQDVDIIVLADMTGEKYTHLDTHQIGEIFEGKDKEEVLKYGRGYYSLNEGSMGKTLRWFEPILKDGKQVGFVMVGKYYNEIYSINRITKRRYGILFILTITFSSICAAYLAYRIKKAILDMEPHEIARLYLQKDSILNGVQEGIIALDVNNEIREINKNAQNLLELFSLEEILEKVAVDIERGVPVSFKEFIIRGKKLFINLQPVRQGENYFGTIITLMEEQEINRVAKEITGIEEVNKNLRATVHEFKNNLHVILGLLKIEEYDEAKNYILQVQHTKNEQNIEFASIEDHYIRALLLSRTIIAKERQIAFKLTPNSMLERQHEGIDSNDLITILGNLLENAFEACISTQVDEKKVEVSLSEDEDYIVMKVKDNGVPIDTDIKSYIYELGISSKGEGRGNGLYLVQNRVDLYEGKIQLQEMEGEKQFIVILPK
nr:sensor histidine kinase [uncultured Cellulosilyticum sp.]